MIYAWVIVVATAIAFGRYKIVQAQNKYLIVNDSIPV